MTIEAMDKAKPGCIMWLRVQRFFLSGDSLITKNIYFNHQPIKPCQEQIEVI